MGLKEIVKGTLRRIKRETGEIEPEIEEGEARQYFRDVRDDLRLRVVKHGRHPEHGTPPHYHIKSLFFSSGEIKDLVLSCFKDVFPEMESKGKKFFMGDKESEYWIRGGKAEEKAGERSTHITPGAFQQ